MDLQAFLSRLHVESGPNAKGEYMCRCPAHDDKSASLSVCVKESSKDGKRRIYFRCQTGKCAYTDILAKLGLLPKDLICDSDDALVPGKVVHTAKPAGDKKPRGKFVCAYQYTDEGGKLLFEACRYQRDDGSKTFLLRQPDPAKPGKHKYTKDGVRMALYRLPEVCAAIQAGKPVFVCEGEKDCDNMAALGHVATTNPMGAGKWGAGDYTPSLKGADLYIIPDNDGAGRDHAQAVARAAVTVAKSVRVLDLTKAYLELPAKGDISDMYKLMGRKAGQEALQKLMRETEPYAADASTKRDEAAEHYGKIFGYCVDAGRICQATQDGPKPLANFVALPVAVVARDDGVNVSKEMVIDGWSASGVPLPRVHIKANQYSAMNWVPEHWDFAASIMPGTATKDKIRYAISEVGRVTAQRLTEYTHTGWRKIGGKWAYLYQGGAIGADDITVDLGSGLSTYRLDGNGAEGFETITYQQGALATLQAKACMAGHVSIPVLGTVFLAPLREFLAATGIAPAYALFLFGSTGGRKSTGIALGLSHYGNFNAKNLPASFNDTANFIRKKAFLLKDMPLVVDDYHPVSSLQERRKMEATAQSLSRAFGDGAERGRMRPDLTLQEAMPPRGVAIISGEDMPNVGQSGLERYYFVHVRKGDVPATDALTAMQELARKGALQKSMRGYIKWLLKQIDEMPGLLHAEWIVNRAMALERTKDGHGRPSEAIAHMMLGYQYMLRYMRDVGAITTEQAVEMMAAAWEVVVQNSKRQADDLREERPSKFFLTAISELLAGKVVGVRDLAANIGDPGAHVPGTQDMIGYKDAQYYYLLPSVAYRAVTKLCNDQGQAFPLTSKMLYKQMREDGVLTPEATTSTSATRPKWIDGRSQRLLWIPCKWIDGGPGPSVEQQKMGLDGFMPVNDEEMPF